MQLQQKNIEQNDTSKQIDYELNKIKNLISKNDVSSNYEKKENGKFNLKINGIILDIDIEDSKLPSVLKLTQDIISIYIKSGYNSEKLYVEESSLSAGQIDRASIMDIKIDNRLLFDTTMLSEEGFVKSFGINPSRSNGIMGKYITFLNQVTERELKINK